jgi:hypothetical protein
MGGVFGVIFYLTLLSGVVQGDLFPSFEGLNDEYSSLFDMFHNTTPSENHDAAKAVFWGFLAGFSERFVPNILDKAGKRTSGGKES